MNGSGDGDGDGMTVEEREAAAAAAALLGRLGGLKGGRARARALTVQQRKAIAAAGGQAFAKLSKKARSESARRGWATRRAARAAEGTER